MAPEKITEKMVNELFELLVSIENAGDMELLFADLCTKNEIEQMTQRLMAAKLMAGEQIRRLPVEENGKLVGMISLGDIAKIRNCTMEAGEALCDISENIRRR